MAAGEPSQPPSRLRGYPESCWFFQVLPLLQALVSVLMLVICPGPEVLGWPWEDPQIILGAVAEGSEDPAWACGKHLWGRLGSGQEAAWQGSWGLSGGC